MKISYVQIKPEFGEKSANIDKALKLMNTKSAELYVLPELFNSGYVFASKAELENLAEIPGEGPTFNALGEFARTNNCAVVFGFPEKAPDAYYNSAAFIDFKGNMKIYRKLHLFYEEKHFFLPGNYQLETFDYNGAKLGMMICYDWIYPEVTRILALKGADIICHTVNLVMPYCQEAMKTRSIENRVFTITANRIGEENRGGKEFTFTGKSQITDCKGNVLNRSPEDKEDIFVADINIEDARVKDINSLNNLWSDRRVEFYKRLGER